MQNLIEAGWNPAHQSNYQLLIPELGGEPEQFLPARVISDHGESCRLLIAADAGLSGSAVSSRTGLTGSAPAADENAPAGLLEVSGRLSGRMLAGGAQLATGDWVVARNIGDAEFVLIEALLERGSHLTRTAPGGGAQVLAANVDLVFLVQGMDRDYNPRRLERYLALARGGGVEACIVLNKRDLITTTELEARRVELRGVAGPSPIVACSATDGDGLEELETMTGSGRSLCLLGSSGAGKSTLANRLLGFARQATADVSSWHGKGRHTTTARELIVLPGRGVLIDTPGLREVALASTADLGLAFPEIEELSADCRFRDCAHQEEPGCAVRAATEKGELDPARLEAYFRLARELQRLHTPATEREARLKRHAERRAAKDLGRLYRTIQDRKRREKGREK